MTKCYMHVNYIKLLAKLYVYIYGLYTLRAPRHHWSAELGSLCKWPGNEYNKKSKNLSIDKKDLHNT